VQLAHFLGASLHPWSARLLGTHRLSPGAVRQQLEAEHAGLLEALASPDALQRMPAGQRLHLQQLLQRLPARLHAATVRGHVAHDSGACTLDLDAEGWRAVAQHMAVVPELASVDVRGAGIADGQSAAAALARCELPQLRRLRLCQNGKCWSAYLNRAPAALTPSLTELEFANFDMAATAVSLKDEIEAYALGMHCSVAGARQPRLRARWLWLR
jgi:hypothetical protein